VTPKEEDMSQLTRIASTAATVVLAPVRVAVRLAAGLLGRGGDEEAPARTPGPDPQRDTTPKSLSDVALARKVESVIFRRRGVEKGKIDVNAADGVVWLRGEAKTPDLINELERTARRVPEVREVENLLHLPKTPAPSRTDTPARQRKTRRSPAKQAQRKVKLREAKAERTPEGAEPKPSDLVRERAGRKPPPMGSEDEPGERG
jgi:osmotically-inducible protein OsmY